MTAYQPRRYRRLPGATDLVACEVAVGESDLMVLAARDLRAEARTAARSARRQIESHLARHPEMLEARGPLPTPPDARAIVAAMYHAGRVAGTGPMAAVAGAVAEAVARALVEHSPEVVVENGGDLFMITTRERTVGIDAGGPPWGRSLALVLPPGARAVCTSSGTRGHSASGGRADAAVVVAPSGAVADALATAVGNRVSGPDDVAAAVEWARAHQGVEHVLVICGETMGAWGALALRRVGERAD